MLASPQERWGGAAGCGCGWADSDKFGCAREQRCIMVPEGGQHGRQPFCPPWEHRDLVRRVKGNKYGARARLRPQGMGKRFDYRGGGTALQRGVPPGSKMGVGGGAKG